MPSRKVLDCVAVTAAHSRPAFQLPVPLFTKGLAVRNEGSNWPGLLDEEGRTRATETRIEMTTALAAARNGVVGCRFSGTIRFGYWYSTTA